MNSKQLKELINQHCENLQGCKFELVENKLSQRADLHAFILMDRILPTNLNIISSARHKEIWFNINVDDFAAVVTEDEVLELVRCGISYDGQYDCLYMFI
jgi:hypothetical protein